MPNHVSQAIIRQNPLRIAVCRRVDETGKKKKKKKKKNCYIPRTWVTVPTEPISTKLSSFVDLVDVINRAKFGVV